MENLVRESRRMVRHGDRRVALLFLLALVYVASMLALVFLERRPAEEAFFEVVCASVYVQCTAGSTILTKLLTVALGFATIGILVFLISDFVQRFLTMELGGRSMLKKISGLEGHYVVAGYGTLGRTVAYELSKRGKEVVVVEKDHKLVQSLKDEGGLAMEGDALDPKVLKAAGLEKAKVLVGALSSDSDNVFLALTAKEINPSANIATRAFAEETLSKLKRAGADIIVMPDILGGRELAREASARSR